jgi:hypothetical protein
MALVLADRVKETTTTAGTGTVTLLGASTGFQSFAVIGNANTTYYCIAGQTTSQWEVGIGTYTASGTTLARTTVLANSAGTQPTALTFSAGTKDVFVTYPAGKSVNYDAAGVLTVSDAAFTLQDNTDATKQAQFQLSGLTTATTRTYTLPDADGTLPLLGSSQTFSGNVTFSNNVTFSGNNTLNLGTSQTSGVITIGGTSGTGNIVLGRSTVNQTTNIQIGATASGSTKTINIGTSGLSGSTTAVSIGSAVSGATSTVTANGKLVVSGTAAAGQVVSAIANTSGTANSQAVLSLDPGNNGFNVRDGQIRSTNNGSNQISLGFYTSNADTPAERFRFGYAGEFGIGGANYGTAGQVLTSGGSGAAPSWAAASGAQANGTIYENSLVISSNYTLTAGKNGMSVGPITINSGVAVTVPSGQRWIIF